MSCRFEWNLKRGVALAKIRRGARTKDSSIIKVLKSSNIRLLTRAGSVSRYWSLQRFASFQRALDEFCHAGQGSGRHFVGAVPIEKKKLRACR